MSVVQEYYNIVWHEPNINKLSDIFHENIVFSFRALDEPQKNFTRTGKKSVMEWFNYWATIADRLNTVIKTFNTSYDGARYISLYNIIQKHDKIYGFHAEETIKLTDGKISEISLVRISKKLSLDIGNRYV